MSVNPYESPDTASKTPEQKRSGCRTVLVTLVSVVVIPSLFAVLCVLPNMRFSTGAAGAARRSICINNLKQIALALHSYQAEHGTLPPAYTVDSESRPLHSWRTLILPYIEQQELYNKIDLTKPWDDPANAAAWENAPSIYHCPSDSSGRDQTTYLAIIAADGCFRADEPIALDDITDDRSRTLMVVEVDTTRSVHWMSPRDASEEVILQALRGERLPHGSGLQATCADGSVKPLDKELKTATLRALVSIAGGDNDAARDAD